VVKRHIAERCHAGRDGIRTGPAARVGDQRCLRFVEKHAVQARINRIVRMHIDLRQRCAVGEAAGSHRVYARRYGYGRQGRAPAERFITDGLHAAADGQVRERRAAEKRIVADGDYPAADNGRR